ncbi:glutamate--cysteine ligase [Neptunicella marina]|uniref:Glutamate--cysteine ligase n=1 Tax=Neptunicella marina TaxID=2125989 RepID=A0A8J6IRH7_9ALTE|nr:glutamate--cysteine ligase [Neptunicella marina]MBC3764537.1 glutamate--cysteine ligase [Neptunicella marina]
MEYPLPNFDLTFEQQLDLFSSPELAKTLTGIRHGIEREALRINPNGSLSQQPHPQALGSALTHELITTDFSESLLEFITPAETDPDVTMAQLTDIHKFVLENIGDEKLWPMSMPCFIKHQDEIPLAEFGTSNVGRMKNLYRRGLKNRYGSMMQAIAGVHFNFSLSDEFWQLWLQGQGKTADRDSISAAYFAMVRNYRRFCWMIPYLFGASPALCESFIKGKNSSLPFEHLGKGTVYLPYATSLRMSDLGYTNDAQSGLYICYNQLDNYIASLRKAIRTPSSHFARFNGKVDGQWQQLNANVLQIENELYSPIRPKQPTRSLEKPTDALADRGVSYIEVRALDVNPFSPIGIEREQFYFLDVFLLYCLLTPSAELNTDKYQETEQNLRTVVERGREPGLELLREGESVSMQAWAKSMFEGFNKIAALLDAQHGHKRFSEAVARQWSKFVNSENCPSAKILSMLKEQQLDNAHLALKMSGEYKQQFSQTEYRHYSVADLQGLAKTSIQQQRDIEAADTQSFDDFLLDYFADVTPNEVAS